MNNTRTRQQASGARFAPRREGPGKGARLRQILALLLMLAGIAALLYPVAATQYNNMKQRQFAAQYQTEVQQASPDTLSAEIEKAHSYNATLSGVPILDPYLSSLTSDEGSEAYEEYLGTLGQFSAMARVRVPAASIDLPVYHGTSDEVIGKGAGHLYGTSLPVGGIGTHAVLTSHTGMSNATLFDHLIDVVEGDVMYVEAYGQTVAYSVDSIKVVLPTEIDDLAPVAGEDLLTLFTCTPYAVNTHRLLVTGHRIPYDETVSPPAAAPLEGLKMETWMWGLIGVAVAAVLLLIVIATREMRSGRASGRAR